MTREQVERVARAFYEAEFLGSWHDARGAIQEHFRDLARTAIATLNRQIAACRSAAKPAAMICFHDTTATSEIPGPPVSIRWPSSSQTRL